MRIQESLLGAALLTTPGCLPDLPLGEKGTTPELIADTAATELTVTANQDGQNLGCIDINYDVEEASTAVVAAVTGAILSLINSPEGDFSDRSAVLQMRNVSTGAMQQSPQENASPDGTLRYDFSTDPVLLTPGGRYNWCLNGNPGSETGSFAYGADLLPSGVAGGDNELSSFTVTE